LCACARLVAGKSDDVAAASTKQMVQSPYAVRSRTHEIVGIPSQMRKTFEAYLNEAQKEEVANIKAFEALKAAKVDRLQAIENDISYIRQKRIQLAEADKMHVPSKQFFKFFAEPRFNYELSKRSFAPPSDEIRGIPKQTLETFRVRLPYVQKEELELKTLQKCLIFETEEAVKKYLALEENEKLYGEMKFSLSRQPSAEKTKRMKAMPAELNKHQAQLFSNYCKDEIKRVCKELQDTRRNYSEQRHQEDIMKKMSETAWAKKVLSLRGAVENHS